jgi:hypothetical protein
MFENTSSITLLPKSGGKAPSVIEFISNRELDMLLNSRAFLSKYSSVITLSDIVLNIL